MNNLIIFPKTVRGLGHVAHTISIDFFSDSCQNNTNSGAICSDVVP